MYIQFRFVPLAAAFALLLAQSFSAAQAGRDVPVTPAAPAAPETARGIPDGKGSTTGAGKFVPSAPAPAAAARTVKPEEAEKQLRAALNVEDLGGGKYQVGTVKFDAAARTVSIPAKVNMRSGVIEYALTTEAGKAHEAMLTTAASPQDLHLACLLLGLKGAPVTGEARTAMVVPVAQGVRILVTWETNGPEKKVPLAALLGLTRGGPGGEAIPMTDGPWSYTGSRFSGEGMFAAQAEGSFISLIRDDSALVNNPGSSRDDDSVHVPNPAALPARGFPVTVILQLPPKS